MCHLSPVHREGSNEIMGSVQSLIQGFFTVPHTIPPGTQD